ncbi:site-2 protease family protein [Candidatus Parcubacteria bacterium]|nr:site-2 protease family protein [Candidatus Parcubacteria bacterium]
MELLTVIFPLIILLFSVIIHEVAHGSVAEQLGDPTAKYAGRLTLNPLKHLDPFGSVILPLILFLLQSPFLIGWAKPVPVNPYNFKDQKWGGLKVAIAGPMANLTLALFFGLLLRFIELPTAIFGLFSIIVILNFLLAIFNLIPIPPLDGSHILFAFLPDSMENVKMFLRQYGFFILLLFIFYGLNFVFGGAIFLYDLVVG